MDVYSRDLEDRHSRASGRAVELVGAEHPRFAQVGVIRWFKYSETVFYESGSCFLPL